MHIPDGFLSPPVWLALDAIAAPAVGLVARTAQRKVEESSIPLLGVMGAFVFAAQMINFPVAPGTSAHLVGAALLAYTLGPWAAAVVMTAILAIQSLVFQDGGLLALGANVVNMALVGVLAAWLPYRSRPSKFGIFAGAVLSVCCAGALALSELLISGIPIRTSLLLVSLVVFLVSGLIEGAITVTVLGSIEKIQPGWVKAPAGERRGRLWFASAALALAVGGVLVASSAPDGLEKLIADAGLASREKKVLQAPMADYEWNLLRGEWPRKAAAGLAGLLAVYGVCAIGGRALARRRKR